MTIDIISYTDAQFAELSEEQLLEVKSAQLKKNRLDVQLQEKKLNEKHRLLKNGMFLSSVWQLYCDKLQAEHDQEVENIRDGLLFYLRFASKPANGGVSAPYTVDYSLGMAERVNIVKTYYMEAYADPFERLAAYKADEVARVYLGEYYSLLHDKLHDYTL